MCQRAPIRRRPCDRSIGRSEKSITNAYRLPSTADTCPAPDRTSLAAASDHPTARCRSPDRRRNDDCDPSGDTRGVRIRAGGCSLDWLFASLAIDPYQCSARGRVTDGNVGESPVAGHVRILRAVCRRSEVADERDRRAHSAQRLRIESNGAKRPGCRVDDVGRRHDCAWLPLRSKILVAPVDSTRAMWDLIASSRSRDREEDLSCRERLRPQMYRSPPHRGPGASTRAVCRPRPVPASSHPHRPRQRQSSSLIHVRLRGPKAVRVTDVAGPLVEGTRFKPSWASKRNPLTIRRKHRMPRRSKTGEDDGCKLIQRPDHDGAAAADPCHAIAVGRNRDITGDAVEQKRAVRRRHDRQPRDFGAAGGAAYRTANAPASAAPMTTTPTEATRSHRPRRALADGATDCRDGDWKTRAASSNTNRAVETSLILRLDLLEAPANQCANGSRHICRQRVPPRLVAQNGRRRLGDILTLERAPSREHFSSTQPNAQMSVRLSTGLPSRLLGAHVGGGAENHAALRHRRGGNRRRIEDGRPTQRRAAAVSIAFASPKSSTFTFPSGVSLMLAGFRSR